MFELNILFELKSAILDDKLMIMSPTSNKLEGDIALWLFVNLSCLLDI